MSLEPPDSLLRKLDGLRTELVELAFELDRRGSGEAADVAMAASVRVGELCDAFPVLTQS